MLGVLLLESYAPFLSQLLPLLFAALFQGAPFLDLIVLALGDLLRSRSVVSQLLDLQFSQDAVKIAVAQYAQGFLDQGPLLESNVIASHKPGKILRRQRIDGLPLEFAHWHFHVRAYLCRPSVRLYWCHNCSVGVLHAPYIAHTSRAMRPVFRGSSVSGLGGPSQTTLWASYEPHSVVYECFAAGNRERTDVPSQCVLTLTTRTR